MTVTEIIERLTRNYAPDTELACEWTDKETYEAHSGNELTDKVWSAVVREYDDSDGIDAMETLEFYHGEVLENGEDD